MLLDWGFGVQERVLMSMIQIVLFNYPNGANERQSSDGNMLDKRV